MMPDWKVAIALQMTSNAPEMLKAITAGVLGLNVPLQQLQKGFDNLKIAIGGAMMAWTGEKIISSMGEIIDHGEKIVHQMELMKIAGNSVADIQKSLASSQLNSSFNPTTTIAENLKHLRELSYAFGDMGKAQQVIGSISQANTVLNAFNPGAGDQVWAMVKSLEEKGEIGAGDSENFQKYLDLMFKSVEASGGRVTPQAFFSAFKYSRTSKYGWDDEFIGGYLPRLIQEYGSTNGGGGGQGGPGNALMSAFSAVVGGRVTKNALDEFLRLGLVDPDKVHQGRGGKISVDPGGFKFSDEMIRNPYEYAQKIAPTIMSETGGDKEKMIEELAKLFQNRTAGDIMTNMILQGRSYLGSQNSPFEKDARLNLRAMNPADAFKSLMQGDPGANMEAFTAQWENFLQSLGQPLVKDKISILQELTKVFEGMSHWAEIHPERIKLIGEALAGLAAGLLAAGTVAVVAAAAMWAPGAAIAIAISGIVTAIGALAALNWQAVADGLKSMWESVKGFFGGLAPGNMGTDRGQGVMPGFGGARKMSYMGGGMLMPASYEDGAGNDPVTYLLASQLKVQYDILQALGGGSSGVGGGGFTNASYTTGSYSSPSAAKAASGIGGGVISHSGPNAAVAANGGTPFNGDFVGAVKKFEGFAPVAQWDYKQWTNGYGTRALFPHERISREEAERRLGVELGQASAAVDAINPHLDAGTRSALADLAFNAGPGALHGIRGAIASGDTEAIRRWLPGHYTTAGGHTLSGLIQRRHEESTWIGHGGGNAIHRSTDGDTHVQTTIKLDGQVIAKQMDKHLASLHRHPQQAPFADGRRGWFSPDMQLTTT